MFTLGACIIKLSVFFYVTAVSLGLYSLPYFTTTGMGPCATETHEDTHRDVIGYLSLRTSSADYIVLFPLPAPFYTRKSRKIFLSSYVKISLFFNFQLESNEMVVNSLIFKACSPAFARDCVLINWDRCQAQRPSCLDFISYIEQNIPSFLSQLNM